MDNEKNILLIHGFNGIPKIFYYFQKELEAQGYKVIIPKFPVREEININAYFKIFDIYRNIMNEDLIVVEHSIGNPMFIKYICKNNVNIGLYISLAGFAEPFHVEGKDVLNQVVKTLKITDEEKEKNVNLIKERYSIYSDNDHIVPFNILEKYTSVVDSKPVFISGIGHMGKKIGLEELPEVIKIIQESNYKKI